MMKYICYQNNLHRVVKEVGTELEIILIHVTAGLDGPIYYPDKETKTISRFDDYSVVDDDFDGVIQEYATKPDV